jgi:hypothetical protein
MIKKEKKIVPKKELRTEKLTLRLGIGEIELITNLANNMNISRTELIIKSVMQYKIYIKEMQEKNQIKMF